MSALSPGVIESTYSNSEQIGLPNWSHVNLMISAKGRAPDGYENQLYDRLFYAVSTMLDAVVTDVSTRLNFPYTARNNVPEADFSFITDWMEISFSMTERVGLPEKAHISVLASSKRLVQPGQELVGLQYLSEVVRYHMGVKRTFIVNNPRPWIQQ